MKTLPRFLLLFPLLVSWFLAGCAPETSRPDAAPRFTVIFSQCNNAEPYRAAQNDAMTRLWSQQPDVKLVIMDAQQDSAKQIAQIETALRGKPDLLIVAPNERAPLTDVMRRAAAAGIKTICLERDILEPHYTTWIRADNHEIGRLAGEFIVAHLKKKHGTPRGRIVELAGLKGVEAEINRAAGAHAVLKQHPQIEFAGEAVANWLQSTAKDRMTEILAAAPAIDVVYARNDPMAMGAYLAAREKGREREMIFVGIDGLPGETGGIKKVADGVLAATFVYPLCVEQAVEIGTRMLREPAFVPEKIYTVPSRIVTNESSSTP